MEAVYYIDTKFAVYTVFFVYCYCNTRQYTELTQLHSWFQYIVPEYLIKLE